MKKSILNLDKCIQFNHDFQKVDMLKILPTSGSMNNINKNGDLKFQSLSSENALNVSASYIYYEIELSNHVDANGNHKDITLENDFFPNMFSQMRLKFATSELETINNPGVYSSMLNFLTINKDMGEIIGWIPDTKKGDTDNKYYKIRKELYKDKFTGYFPLNIIFGSLQCFNKIVYCCQLELILTRNIKDELIFYGIANTQANLNFTTIEWHIPELKLNPKSEVNLLDRLNSDKEIKMNYLNRLCSVIDIQRGSTFSFQVANVAYRPKYIIMGFKEPNITYQTNNNLFLADGLHSVQIQVNNTYFPNQALNINIANNNIFEAYYNYINVANNYYFKGKKRSDTYLSLTDFKNLYPIFYFDISNQDEKLIVNGCSITIHLKKSDTFIPKCYVLIIEEKYSKIMLSNGKFTLIENVPVEVS